MTKTLKTLLHEQDLSAHSVASQLSPQVQKTIEDYLGQFNVEVQDKKYLSNLVSTSLTNLFMVPIHLEEKGSEISEEILTSDQQMAWQKICSWLDTKNKRNDLNNHFFVLKGYPGTGKTFLMRLLDKQYPNLNIFFSAPTNKAAKVLSNSVNKKVRTTFSVLGLRMVHDEDEMYLDYSIDTPHFSSRSLLVVDETGMVGTQLYQFIRKVALDYNIKVLFVGDPAQLNPVKESNSKTWKATKYQDNRALLKQPVRFDNQLFKLSHRIRKHIKQKDWSSPIKEDYDQTGGVYVLSHRDFVQKIQSFENPTDFIDNKIVAWRNKTVNKYNKMIREGFGFYERYEPSDILLLAEPIERDGVLIAHTDDEFVVQSVDDEYEVKVDEDYVPVYRLELEGDQKLQAYVPMDDNMVKRLLAHKANSARRQTNKTKRRQAWRDFWETRAKFQWFRHGYALTAHRIQGSTVKNVFVDQHDILANPKKKEAFRALNVACTRPTTCLYTY